MRFFVSLLWALGALDALAIQTVSVTDADGDLVTLQLIGAGLMAVTLDDPDLDGRGAIETITVSGTDDRSTLRIRVRKVGDGRIRVGSIVATGPLRAIDARVADVGGGEGVQVDGYLGALTLGQARDSVIALTGAGLPVKKLVLGRLTIVGLVSNSTIEINGSAGVSTVGALRDSRFLVGFTPADVDDLMAGGVFRSGVTNKSLSIRGVRLDPGKALINSVIAATHVGKVTVSSVETNNGQQSFGILGQTIRTVTTRQPRFAWNRVGPDTQGIGDFVVMRMPTGGGGTNLPPAAPTGLAATGGVQQVAVTWNNVTGATSYNLYRASQSGVNKSNFAGLLNGTKFTGATSPFVDSAQLPGRTNFYVVTALNAHGESAESAQASAIVQAPGNEAPTAGNDVAATLQNEAVSVFVLFNDSDPDGDALTVTGFSQPGNGTVTFTNNVARYTPAASFTGTNTFNYTINDGRGGSAVGAVTVHVHALPADPASVAPPAANGVATLPGTATKFLYTGANRIQFGVNPDDIEFKRAAVLRGKVKTAANAPLAGVHVSVPDHPEFGYTFSRADGIFDLAVNGGGVLVVTFQKQGYIPVHRQLQTRWQDYTVGPDVVLLPLDDAVTPVTLGGGVQVARGTVKTDSDGTRRATLIVQPGTTGQFFFPNGATSTVTTLHLRLTEFTVGPNGPAAMPALLPLTSSYTYCVDISADEEIAAGATTVLLSQPASLYIENFLGVPVGTIVPLGSYDPAVNAWVGYPNGRVVKILSATGGLANVDTTGNGVADNTGLTTAERQQLATLYSAGQELWRAPIPHFSATPWDPNYGFQPPADGVPPRVPSPRTRGGPPYDNPERRCGSIIEVENQILGEAVPVVGTPFRLHYQSDRVAGFAAAIEIPVSGTNVPASATGIQVDFTLAGRSFHFEFPPQPNLSTNFIWDGLDAYGRTLIGGQRMVGQTCYTYNGQYQQPTTGEVAWASLSGTPMIQVDRSRQDFFLCDFWELTVNSWNAKTTGLGGWTLDVHHAYDPLAQVLHYGNGRRRSATSLGTTVIKTVAGGGCPFCPFVDVPAKEGRVFVFQVAVAADGTVYWAGGDGIYYVDQNGIIRRAAGGGTLPPDGVPATSANFEGTRSLALAPDGSIYAVINFTNIVHVGTDGIVRRFAGGGSNCLPGGIYTPSGDGGPATNACVMVTSGSNLALGPDGSLYIADGFGTIGVSSVRRVDPNGIITTVAGGGDLTGDGIPATKAQIRSRWVALGADGTLYILDGITGAVRQVGGDGKIKTIAGGGSDPNLDGGLPTDAQLFATTLAVGPTGILVTESSGALNRVRLVAGEVIRTIVGSTAIDPTATTADGVPAGRAALGSLGNAVFAPDGSIYLSDAYNPGGGVRPRIRRVASARPGLDVGDSLIAEEDGSEVFVFDSFGRHKQTLDALTGAVRYQFGYDAEERLVTVTDGDGNVTTIQRNSAGNPASITGPYGQTTTFTVDGNGYLATIQNPADETVALAYTPGGLLTSLTDPRGHTTTFSYDIGGRFLGETDPAGGSQTLTRTDGTNIFTVAVGTALGRTNSQTVVTLPTGARVRTSTTADGLQDVVYENTDGSTSNVFANGMTAFSRPQPDPRWGMLAPVAATNVTATPSGLVNVLTSTNRVTLTDPNDLLSLSNLTQTVVRNGNTWSTSYAAVTRTETATSPEGRQVITEYDNQRRIMMEAEWGLAVVEYARDSRGRTVGAIIGSGPEQRVYTYQYNAAGYLETIIDPLSRTNRFTYDAAGRMLTRTTPGALVIQYAYDANGNLSGVTPPGRPAHSFSNSAVNLPVTYTAPPIGASNLTSFAYNADRQLTQITRPDGRAILFDYGAGGSCNCERLSKLTIQRGDFISTYDPATGNLASLTAPGGIACAYAYDGALLTSATWTGPVTGAVAYAYNQDFRMTTNSVNGTNPIAFSYDADGLLVQAGALTLTRHPQHGLRAATALGNVAEGFTYNAFGEMTNHTAAIGSTNLYAVGYLRDKLGRITQKTETILGAATVYDYQYDQEGRLTNVLQNATTLAAYTYDANGNRLRVDRPAGTTTNVYDAQDRLVSSANLNPPSAISYNYAASGELTNKTAGAQATSYTYDELGNLLQVILPDATAIEYLTDGYNRRIGKKVNGTLVKGFLYQDGLRPIAELDGNNTVVSRFVYAEQKSTPDYMVRDGATYRIITDERGSPRLVVNAATGAVAQRLDYDEFGNVTLDTNPGFQPFGFAGGLYDPETGLVRFGARDFDPATGRWMAKDPILFAAGDANLYQYCFGDPVNWVDKVGKVPEPNQSVPPRPDPVPPPPSCEERTCNVNCRASGPPIPRLNPLERLWNPLWKKILGAAAPDPTFEIKRWEEGQLVGTRG